jgi:hypothetical protein
MSGVDEEAGAPAIHDAGLSRRSLLVGGALVAVAPSTVSPGRNWGT